MLKKLFSKKVENEVKSRKKRKFKIPANFEHLFCYYGFLAGSLFFTIMLFTSQATNKAEFLIWLLIALAVDITKGLSGTDLIKQISGEKTKKAIPFFILTMIVYFSFLSISIVASDGQLAISAQKLQKKVLKNTEGYKEYEKNKTNLENDIVRLEKTIDGNDKKLEKSMTNDETATNDKKDSNSTIKEKIKELENKVTIAENNLVDKKKNKNNKIGGTTLTQAENEITKAKTDLKNYKKDNTIEDDIITTSSTTSKLQEMIEADKKTLEEKKKQLENMTYEDVKKTNKEKEGFLIIFITETNLARFFFFVAIAIEFGVIYNGVRKEKNSMLEISTLDDKDKNKNYEVSKQSISPLLLENKKLVELIKEKYVDENGKLLGQRQLTTILKDNGYPDITEDKIRTIFQEMVLTGQAVTQGKSGTYII